MESRLSTTLDTETSSLYFSIRRRTPELSPGRDRMITRRRIFAALAMTLLPLASPLSAQDAPRVAGSWEGALSVSGLSLRLAFEIRRDSAGGLGGTLISIDQGGARIPVTATERGDSVRFEAATIGAVYQGRLN